MLVDCRMRIAGIGGHGPMAKTLAGLYKTFPRLREKEPARNGTSRAVPAAGARDLRLDFFRGLALFFIFIDHIPDNTLSYFTLQAVGFCDAAEVFIFISGYTAALVYGRTMLSRGALFAGAQVGRRVWQLYVAHIFLFVIFTAE